VGLVIAPVPTAFADRANLQIFPPNKPSFGMTYAEWAAKWWQWEFSLPTSVNPWFDTGANAGIGQSGPVYFLTGILTGAPVVKRTIRIPEGKALFFPIFNSWADNVDVKPPKTFQELRAQAASLINTVSELHVSIDGRNLDNLFSYRVKSPPFCDWFPSEDNVYMTQFGSTFSGWTCPVASDGFWLMLAPLPRGYHTINFGGTSGNFTLDITYDVNVFSVDTLGH
jgi:hypothetical protein